MNQPRTIPVLLITGTVGVGKSSIADEVYETLKSRKVPIALINIDEFGYAYPHPSDDRFNARLQLKNIAATRQNYLDVGVENFVIPCVIEDLQSIEHFRKAIPNADIFVVRLDASLVVLEQRIKARPMGGSMEWHLQRAAELKEIFQNNGVGDVIIDTDNKSIPEVVKEVIAAWSSLRTDSDN